MWNIKTIASWARANMLHVVYHWPQHASVKLWPMAINYAVWVFNHLLWLDTDLCPDKMWSQSRTTHDDLRRAHIWGCPVYVLEPASRRQENTKMVTSSEAWYVCGLLSSSFIISSFDIECSYRKIQSTVSCCLWWQVCHGQLAFIWRQSWGSIGTDLQTGRKILSWYRIWW